MVTFGALARSVRSQPCRLRLANLNHHHPFRPRLLSTPLPRPRLPFPTRTFAGIFGGFTSALFAWAFYTPANAPLITHGAAQPLYQLMSLAAAVGAAAASGLISGFIVTRVSLPGKQELEVSQMYEDAVFWHEVEDGE